MADPHGRWRSFPRETPDTVLGPERASGDGVRRAVSRQALDESVRKKAYRSVRCSHTLAVRGRMAFLQRQCGGRGFGSIHGGYVEPGEPSCGLVGVCGRSRMTIAHHIDSSVTVLAQVPVVCHAAL